MRTACDGMDGVVAVGVAGGIYVTTAASDWLLVTGPRAPLGPLTLQLAGPVRRDWEPGMPVRVRDGILSVGPDRIDLTTTHVEPAPALLACASGVGAAMAEARAALPGPPAELRDGLMALGRGQLARAVPALAGRGTGLTPAGDDVLAGYCAWCYADGAHDPTRVLELAHAQASPLGLAYLRCAVGGELVDLAAQLMASVRDADVNVVTRRAAALARWGASSGAALLWGMDAALQRRVAHSPATSGPDADARAPRRSPAARIALPAAANPVALSARSAERHADVR
jgi:hypothetical protein